MAREAHTRVLVLQRIAIWSRFERQFQLTLISCFLPGPNKNNRSTSASRGVKLCRCIESEVLVKEYYVADGGVVSAIICFIIVWWQLNHIV